MKARNQEAKCSVSSCIPAFLIAFSAGAIWMKLMDDGRRKWYGAAGVVLLMLASGCGGDPYPVDGHVVWKDGSPAKELAGAQVVFELPEKQTSARGVIQP